MRSHSKLVIRAEKHGIRCLTRVGDDGCSVSGEIKSLLHARASSTGNVRKLGKLVDEVISLVLVRSMLSDAPNSSNATKTKDAA